MTPEVKEFCGFAVQSGFFADSGIKSVGAAIMKVAYGVDLGLSPTEALQWVYSAKGKFGLESNAIANAIANHPHYDFEILEHNEQKCTVQILWDGKPKKNSRGQDVEPVTFNFSQAVEMGVSNNKPWKVDRLMMLFYKAISRAYKLHCRDVFKTAVESREDLEDAFYVEVNGVQPGDAAIQNAGRRGRSNKGVASEAQAGLSQASGQQEVTDVEALPGAATNAESDVPANPALLSETTAEEKDELVTPQEINAGLASVKGNGWNSGNATTEAKDQFGQPLQKLTKKQFNTLLAHAKTNRAPEKTNG